MLSTKFDSHCSNCNNKLPKGTNCYYWPRDKKVFCIPCGENDYRQFLSSAADEDVYNGVGNPYAM
jgi:hypothetical protein